MKFSGNEWNQKKKSSYVSKPDPEIQIWYEFPFMWILAVKFFNKQIVITINTKNMYKIKEWRERQISIGKENRINGYGWKGVNTGGLNKEEEGSRHEERYTE